MRIAFFSDTFPPEINSVSMSLATLSQELACRGHEVLIFTVNEEEKENKKSLDWNAGKSDLLKIYRTDGKTFMPSTGRQQVSPITSATRQQVSPITSANVANNLGDQPKKNSSNIIHKDFREILTSKPDIIHIHTPFSIGKQGLRASRLLKIPAIGSHHSFYINYRHSALKSNTFIARFLMKKYVAWFYNKCRLVIVPSKAIAEEIVHDGLTAPLSIIPNPINIKDLQPSASKSELKKQCGLPDFSLVYFGNITYEKRIHELLKVFALLSPKYPKMKLSIIGDGSERKNLEIFAKRLNIREKVIFFGMLRGQHFIDAISANDVFITASDTENQPLPIFEAMALGLPQIVAKSPIDEYVENGVTGFITDKYSFMELSEKLTKLIENPELREKMSENSKKVVLKYDIKNIADEYERIYSDFVKS